MICRVVFFLDCWQLYGHILKLKAASDGTIAAAVGQPSFFGPGLSRWVGGRRRTRRRCRGGRRVSRRPVWTVGRVRRRGGGRRGRGVSLLAVVLYGLTSLTDFLAEKEKGILNTKPVNLGRNYSI